jgi:hypothetical protein
MDDPYKVFNQALKTFIRELISAFPDVKDFKTFLTLYKMAKSISRKSPQKIYQEVLVARYRTQVINEDPSFMTIELFNDEHIPLPMRILVKDLNCLRDCWIQMKDDDRKSVWDHLKVLIVLSDKCAEP